MGRYGCNLDEKSPSGEGLRVRAAEVSRQRDLAVRIPGTPPGSDHSAPRDSPPNERISSYLVIMEPRTHKMRGLTPPPPSWVILWGWGRGADEILFL